MARWVSYIDNSVGDGANTIAGIISNGPTYGIGISSDVYITGLSTFGNTSRFTNTVRLDGQLRDGDNAFGSSGQVLSSDGTDTRWINAGELSAGAASQVAVNDDSNTNAERFITIVDAASGNNNVKTDASLKYNPSTNTITTVNITGNVTGNVTGNASSATVLQTTRTIGGVSFNGSANINLPGVNQTGNQNTSGSSASCTGNSATATILQNTRTIGGVSFNGSANINLPGVNEAGNQNTSGNAATATVLETTRNFSISGEITANAQSFNGSGNLTLSATVDNEVIDEANLKVSNAPSDGYFLQAQSGDTGGLRWSQVTLPSSNTLSGTTLASGITASSITSLGTLTGLSVNGNVSVTTGSISGNGSGLTTLNASNISSGTVAAARLPQQESGASIVGNFGQWESHGTYTNFNTEPAYWGWNFVQGTTNAPNTTSTQWYRCRLSLGSDYGKGTDGGDYSLEMAIPRNSQSSAGGLHIRAIENGVEQSWVNVAANASLLSTGTVPDARLSTSSLFVTGMIIIWNGAANAIPSGWVLCNGSNSTPDLRDKFVIGAGNSYAVDASGGSKDAVIVSHSHTINNHTHTVSGNTGNQSANHSHTFSGSGSSSHSHNITATNGDDHNDNFRRIENGRNDSNFGNSNFNTDSATVNISISGNTGNNSGNHSHSWSGTTGNPSDRGTNSQGVSGTDKNLPPYYALCYIMKT